MNESYNSQEKPITEMNSPILSSQKKQSFESKAIVASETTDSENLNDKTLTQMAQSENSKDLKSTEEELSNKSNNKTNTQLSNMPPSEVTVNDTRNETKDNDLNNASNSTVLGTNEGNKDFIQINIENLNGDNGARKSYNYEMKKNQSATIYSSKLFSLKSLREKFYSLSLKKHKTSKKKKIQVGSDGQTVYKKTSTSAIISAIQLGIAYSVGKLNAKPERDILLQDFFQIEDVYFPASGTNTTPSHKFADFSLIDYSPNAFRYFRDIFSISPQDFLMSLSIGKLRELGNPGASGSLFFLSEDDVFIIKSVDAREAKFLQQLLPGYYMNLHQNPHTFLPKFFGMYCFKSGGRNIRLVVMNNLIPSKVKIHQKYDLKGSTFKRRASGKEKTKEHPTYKDLDFMEHYPNGIKLTENNYRALVDTLERDLRVLESFKIMDYSLLICVHNVTVQKRNYKYTTSDAPLGRKANNLDNDLQLTREDSQNKGIERNSSQYSRALSILTNNNPVERVGSQSDLGGIPATNDKGESLILFVGIIDILQNYRLIKKTEHHLKALLHDGDSISVHNPTFYATRFMSFCKYAFQIIGKKSIKPPSEAVTKSHQKVTFDIDYLARKHSADQRNSAAATATTTSTYTVTNGIKPENLTTKSKVDANHSDGVDQVDSKNSQDVMNSSNIANSNNNTPIDPVEKPTDTTNTIIYANHVYKPSFEHVNKALSITMDDSTDESDFRGGKDDCGSSVNIDADYTDTTSSESDSDDNRLSDSGANNSTI